MLPAQEKFQKIYFEIGNICNLQCTFCPVVDREKFRVSLQEAKVTLEKIRSFTNRVCFHLMGEPLAHPEFSALVEIAQDVNTPLEITTNGTLLNEQNMKALLNPIVAQVNFSLQSFEDNFPSANASTYLSTILKFCDRAIAERPDLYINLRLWNQPEGANEDLENEKILQSLESHFHLTINRRIDARLKKSKKIKDRIYIHYDTRFQWPDLNSKSYGEKGSCYGTRSHIGIHADGTVVPCCLDKEAKIPLGNIKESSLTSILESERFQKIKKGFESGKKVEALCQHCHYASRFS
jgi:radical SAM protein with 4Fe4S-binding SPASM domain